MRAGIRVVKGNKPRRLKRICPDPLDARAIGRRIAEARKKRDWRQCDLAAVLGMSKGAVVGWENGVRIPNRDALLALSAATRRKIDWLLYGRRTLWSRKACGSSPVGGNRVLGRPDSRPGA